VRQQGDESDDAKSSRRRRKVIRGDAKSTPVNPTMTEAREYDGGRRSKQRRWYVRGDGDSKQTRRRRREKTTVDVEANDDGTWMRGDSDSKQTSQTTQSHLRGDAKSTQRRRKVNPTAMEAREDDGTSKYIQIVVDGSGQSWTVADRLNKSFKNAKKKSADYRSFSVIFATVRILLFYLCRKLTIFYNLPKIARGLFVCCHLSHRDCPCILAIVILNCNHQPPGKMSHC
jgi:hypothetical protein